MRSRTSRCDLSAIVGQQVTVPLGTSLTYASGIPGSVRSLGFQRVTPGVAGAVGGEAAVFQITVHNSRSSALPASHMMNPRGGYGQRYNAADLVCDRATGLGSDSLWGHPSWGEPKRIRCGWCSLYPGLVRAGRCPRARPGYGLACLIYGRNRARLGRSIGLAGGWKQRNTTMSTHLHRPDRPGPPVPSPCASKPSTPPCHPAGPWSKGTSKPSPAGTGTPT